ncbi:6-phosphofructokinase [Facklamia sp. DSM 111018]|uniref:ATP-dependent 6-phosphofructokinase n=1 Tax=Facklamia lactis TaxID=2749967 RepID=A0ABS0LQA7_9LACT|nr:ATP-dependent 6-phosphofructokinase [Facklamia lactis]MBG9979831.1 6-phosphofructokinase [Facklamia lactis]MBG9985489.1 6-phosphofructokinase [Facklamia lactis]
MRRLAVLTSGGDAPGMNAAIRAVVEEGLHHEIEVMGVQHGFKGLVEGEYIKLGVADVTHAIRRGGTILYSARYPEFKEEAVQKQAIKKMEENGIEGLIVIGGDGSFAGALSLTKLGFPAVGIPGTIDNDIPGTEYTIGFDSAMTAATIAIDNITDTAASHNRTFVVEVMGRNAGDIAIWAGVGTGADAIIIPEEEFFMGDIVRRVRASRQHGKDYSIIVLAEGVMGVEDFIKEYKKEAPEQSVRGVNLSHIQRGGNPTGRDRVFATLMGAKAVDLILHGQSGIYVGIIGEELAVFDIVETLEKVKHKVRDDLYELNRSLTDRY